MIIDDFLKKKYTFRRQKGKDKGQKQNLDSKIIIHVIYKDRSEILCK
jgi:hypothetical protein